MSKINQIEVIKSVINSSIEIKAKLLKNDKILDEIRDLADCCVRSLRSGGKIIFAGNGGSFADSQHLAAEFVSRLQFDRDPLASLALGTNSSVVTAVGNDYGYEQVFKREIQAIGKKGDVFIPISTSGNSPNILAAAQKAVNMGLDVVGWTGEAGGELNSLCRCIRIPSNRTERIQECHIMIGHIVCGLVEDILFGTRQI